MSASELPYTPRMCRASDRGYMDVFREGQKLERELAEDRADNVRLREALGKIADLCQLTCVTFEQQSVRATRIAREALAGKEFDK